jgi:hypothetical protein
VRCVGEGPDPPPSLPPLNEEEDGEEGHDTHPQWTAQQRLEARLDPRSLQVSRLAAASLLFSSADGRSWKIWAGQSSLGRVGRGACRVRENLVG